MGEKYFKTVKKRDGRIVPFDKKKIVEAVFKATKAAGKEDKEIAEIVASKTTLKLKQKFKERTPGIEDIQNIVEQTLIEEGYAEIAKAYITYRHERSLIRDTKAFLSKAAIIVDDYLGQTDWRVAENANTTYALSGLQGHIAGAIIAEYALTNIYPKDISEAHRTGDFHLHDLSHGTFSAYCAGWSIRQLLTEGFNGVPNRVSAKPAKHLNAFLGQLVNFFGTLQNEWAGAQAVSSFDTYLAPLVAADKLKYEQVKQSIQEFVFAINATSRWGNQVPFTNTTIDWTVPEDMKEQKAIVGGKLLDQTYSDFQEEMDIINKAFIETMSKGDMNGRIFSFPIPTYNITKDFEWGTENVDALFEMTAKYGTPYFQNFVNSSLKPQDVRSMCCRLRLNMKELRQKTGGLFGSGEQTGSIGVVTLNMGRIGYLSKSEEEFLEKTSKLMELAKNSLEIKRKECEKNMKQGLLPYSYRYLRHFDNHFSTIGLIGMNEACLNFLGENIATQQGKRFSLRVLDLFRENLEKFQEETGHIYNLEATPGEGTSYRLAKIDKKKYPEIITAGEKAPFYTNSTHLPVDATDDIFDALTHQDNLQVKYTGGTVLHGFLGEKMSSGEGCKLLVKRIAQNFKLPYYTITPTFSICPVHGYIAGQHFNCPIEANGGK